MPRIAERLQKARLIPWALTYLASAWFVLQVLDFVADHFDWAAWVVPAATIFAGLAFPAVVVIAWFHGERGAQRATATEVILLLAIVGIAGAGAFIVARRAAPPATPVAGTPVDSAATSAIQPNSIAVLPFVNVSGKPENDFLSDGIAEEILDAIAKIPGVRVAARTSSFAFKGKKSDIAEIARTLGVAHIVEGSVQRAGDSLRITARLVRAANGSQTWSRKFDRAAADLFAVEDEISRAIAAQLQADIATGLVLTGGTENVDAHDLFLQGLDRWSHRNTASLHQAIDLFERAVVADPRYARAHAGLALAYSVLPNYDDTASPAASFSAGKDAARRALAIDPNSAEANAALSEISQYEDEIVQAETYARHAIQLNPNYATAHQFLAEALAMEGNVTAALRASGRAVYLDPLSAVALGVHAWVLSIDGQFDASMSTNQKAIQIDPLYTPALNNLATTALANRNYFVARDAIRQMFAPQGRASVADTIVDAFTDRRKVPDLTALLEAQPPREQSVATTLLYELLGNRESALLIADNWVQAGRSPWEYWTVMGLPQMKELREDPRFPAALRWPRMNVSRPR